MKAEFLHLPLEHVTADRETRRQGSTRDPRLHLLLLLAGSIVLLVNKQLVFQFAFFLFMLTLLVWWGMRLRMLLQALIPVLIMMSLTVGYHLLFAGGANDYGAHPILYSPKLERGLLYAFRLGGLYLLIVQVTRLLRMERTADVFLFVLSSLSPLQRMGLPIGQASLALRAGLSSISGISQAMREMNHAAQIFHPRPENQNYWRSGRISRFVQLLVPMLVTSIRRADHLALALRARGYQPASQIRLLTDMHWLMRDTLEIAAIVLMVGLLWIVTL